MVYVKSFMSDHLKAGYYDVADEQLQTRGYQGALSETGKIIDDLKAKAITPKQSDDLFLLSKYRQLWKDLDGNPERISDAFTEIRDLRKKNTELTKSLGESKEYIADIRDACVVAFAMDYDADPLEFLRQEDEDECEVEENELAGTIFQNCQVQINFS